MPAARVQIQPVGLGCFGRRCVLLSDAGQSLMQGHPGLMGGGGFAGPHPEGLSLLSNGNFLETVFQMGPWPNRLDEVPFQCQRPGTGEFISLRHHNFESLSFLNGVEKQGRIQERSGRSEQDFAMAFFAIVVGYEGYLKTRILALQRDVIHIGIDSDPRRAVCFICSVRRRAIKQQCQNECRNNTCSESA
ncbi:hypothetical protein BRAS3843_660064 [Bradyrhizobium sp. STM 3843]|nr:hypothetical protein BRAS3843_660064 [Bradyrhizobium sp. STM 3843]